MNQILLVEDDYHLGLILKDQLEFNGYKVTLLRLPNETIDKLLENEYDLVILDKLLSGIDGTQICSEIRNTVPVSTTPILMMSGWDGAGKDCLDAGATNFIAKPFEVQNFLDSLEATIAKAKDLQE